MLPRYNVWLFSAETALTRSAILIIAMFCFVLSFPASSKAITKEQWNWRYGSLKARPLLRHDRITTCISDITDEMSEDMEKEIEAMNTAPVSEVIANVCTLLINGIANGKLTYQQYQEWKINPTDSLLNRLQ
jgi:hypothetical protein